MTRGHVHAFGMLVLSGIAFAQSEGKPPSAKDPVKWNVRVDLQMLAVRNEDAPRLIWRLQNRRQSEAAADELQKMLASGRAELIAWPVTWAADRSFASAKTIQEVRSVEDVGSGIMWLSPFETRNAGLSLDLEATVDADGLNVHLNLAPDWVELDRFRAHRLGRTPGGVDRFVEQPQFNVQRVTTSLRVRSGERQLIGVFYGAEPKDKVTLFILRAVILPVDHAPSSK